MTHAHFLQLDGFKLLCTKEEITEGLIGSALSEKVDFMGMSRRVKAWGRFSIPYYLSFHSPHHPRFVEGVLLFEFFFAVLETGRLRFPSDVAAVHIKDKSNPDAGLALLQIPWCLLQTAVRSGEGKVVTELELPSRAERGNVSLLVRQARGCQEAACVRTKEEGEMDARYEEMERVWELHSEGSDEETEMRTKASGAEFIMDVSKRVYSTLLLIPCYISHFWPTYCSLHSVPRDVLLFKKRSRSPAPVLHDPHTPLASLDPTRHTLSPLTRFFLGLDRTLHSVTHPLRLIITKPVIRSSHMLSGVSMQQIDTGPRTDSIYARPSPHLRRPLLRKAG